jgi:hypothetical protein
MKTLTPLSTTLIVLALGVTLAVPAAAIAAFGPPANAGTGSGNGSATRNGSCVVPTATAAVVQPANATLAGDLKYMREEEKLAHDVYTALAAKWGVRVFSNIAVAEQRHTNAIATLLDRYSVTDPADGKAAGVFVNADLQKLYNDLVAKGSVSAAEAYKVGKLIEDTDIADLDKRIARTSQADVTAVLKNLRAGSVNHLAAFNRQISGTTGSAAGAGQAAGSGRGAGTGAGLGAGRGMGNASGNGMAAGRGGGAGRGAGGGTGTCIR